MLSLLFNVGVYGSAIFAADLLRRKATCFASSATFQRLRWRRFATERDLVATGVPGEYTGTWQGLTVVLDTRFVPGRQLVLGLRVLGLFTPSCAADALRTHPRFGAWRTRVEDGELRLDVSFRGSALQPADLEAWLDAVRATCTTEGSAYRTRA